MKFRFSSPTAPSAVLLACLALAGCGGGGSSPTTTGGSPSITGSVIDGYIEGASVCLDLNANQACDAGEPSATTAKDGSYKLDTSALTADQIKAAHLLTVVPTTAKDADDAGKTLADAGKNGFSFLAPAAAYVTADGSAITGAVISPLTTLVSHDMIASGTPLATAKTNVRGRLGLAESTDLTQDFVAKKDAGLMQTAQMLTVAIGEVKAQAKTGETSDRQAFFAALDYLQKQVAELTKAYAAAKKEDDNAKPVDLVKKAFETEAAKPVVADLLAEAKKTTESAPASASAVVALIEQGFYNANYALEDCSYCTPTYSKVLGSAGKIALDLDYRLENGAWVKDTSNGDNYFTLTSAGWKSENDCAAGQSVTYAVGSDGVTTVTFCDGTSERITARTVDASGKTLSALNLNPPAQFAQTTMPAGSQLSWLTFANTEDQYNLHTGYELEKYGTKFTNLDDFIAAYSLDIRRWSNLAFTFQSYGGINLFDPSTVNTETPKFTGTATYTRKTVYGVDLLIINAQAQGNDPGELYLFAVKDGKVYGGDFRPKTAKNDTEPMFNKTMINAILKAGSKPEVKE